MRLLRHTLLAVVSLALTGCAHSGLTPAGEAVRVTADPEVVRDCEYVAEVPGAEGWDDGLVGQSATEVAVIRELRNTAGRLGANIVLMLTESTTGGVSTQRAEGYLCAD